MIIHNVHKPFAIIGYENSTLTQEYYEALTCTVNGSGEKNVKVINPDDFKRLKNKTKYQYILGFALELDLRKNVIGMVNEGNLDCFSYIYDNCFISHNAKIGKGVFIAPFSSVCRHAEVKDHACIETYCLVSHYSTIGENTIVRSGTKIAGRTSIGNNCTLGFNSGVSNNINVTDHVHLSGFSNITKHAEISGIYAGTSARLIKKDTDDSRDNQIS
jgi:UDP-3-O-[3-hydroxymyristoyl] glucosamine N-acyltransferase